MMLVDTVPNVCGWTVIFSITDLTKALSAAEPVMIESIFGSPLMISG